MQKNRESLIADIAMGALAGVAATWVMGKATSIIYQRESEETRQLEKEARGGKMAYGVAAEKMASVGGKELSKEQRQRYGNALHWALGAGAGAVYGAVRERTPWASLGFGTLFGVIFWLAVDEGANTVFGFTPPPGEFPWQAHGRGLAGHIVYGVAVESMLQLSEAV